MKLKITIGENERTAIVLPIEHAGIAAKLLANATIYVQDGYYGYGPWKVAEQQIRIEYTDEKTLAPATKRELDALKETERKSADWLKEYQRGNDLQKQVDQLRASLETLQAAVVCTVAPEAGDKPDTETEEYPAF